MHSTHPILATAALSLLAATFVPRASAQQLGATPPPTAPRAPQALLDAFGISNGTVQLLALPRSGRSPFQFTVQLDRSPVTIVLQPFEIRSADFQLMVDDGNGPQLQPTPAPTGWRGSVEGFADSAVAASMRHGAMTAWIDLGNGGTPWYLEPSRRFDPSRAQNEHLIYAGRDAHHASIHCGTDESVSIDTPRMQAPQARKICEIAIDCDLEYYQRYNNDTQAVQDAVVAHVNAVSRIYERDVDVQYQLTSVTVRTARRYSNIDMSQLLSEFRRYWNRNQGGVRRDVAHLFTGKGGFGGVVGIAYLGVVCDLASAYGVDKAYSSFGENVGLVAHELGHNWNAPHCDGAGTCNIMCSGLGGCNARLNQFAPGSISTITSFKNSRSCLSNPSAPTLTSVTPSQVPVFPFAQLTLSGSGFSGASAVSIGGTSTTSFTLVNDNTITMNAVAPGGLGPQPVTVEIAGVSSNAVSLDVRQANPPVHEIRPFSAHGIPLDVDMAGDPLDAWVLLAGFGDLSTFPFLGFDVLNNRLAIASGALNGAGYARFVIQVPSIPLPGLNMGTQVVTLGEQTGDLAYVTDLKTTFFLN